MFSPPSITLKWGEYFRPDADEQLKRVQVAQAGLGAPTKILTRQAAIDYVKPVFGIENTAALIEALEAEEKLDTKKDLENQEETLKIQAKHAPPKPTKAPPK